MRKRMSEIEVSKSVRKYLFEKYLQEGVAIWQFEAMDIDFDRPDLLFFVEYQSPRRQWVTHSVESKCAKRYVTVTDKRKTCPGVQQARKYYANYRWLAISRDLFYELTYEEWQKLKKDCRRSYLKTGLLVAYKTKVDKCVNPGYHQGSWIEKYKADGQFVKEVSK